MSSPAPPASRPVHRVLVVEDSDDIRELTTMLLSSYGHVVSEASDGCAGLKAALEEKPAPIEQAVSAEQTATV